MSDGVFKSIIVFISIIILALISGFFPVVAVSLTAIIIVLSFLLLR